MAQAACLVRSASRPAVREVPEYALVRPDPGGVECLFGDGSDHLIKHSINRPTWIQFGSINGGEIISSEHYSDGERGASAPCL